MEYEIEEGEHALFDDSTNPSLKYEHRQATRHQSSVRPEDYPAEKRRMQKAVLIPDEEDQAA
jgi:hypothetical protein